MMRKSAGLLTIAAILIAAPAGAQTQQNNVQYVPVPVYNTTGNNGQVYYAPNNGMVPVYNNMTNTPALPMQQMIAGKNAPSYNFNGQNQTQPYNFQSGGNTYVPQGVMPPSQQTQMYQQQLMDQGEQMYQPQMPVQQQQQQATAGGLLNGGPFGNTPDAQVPVRKRVVYNERNNPLSTPQRLFNPDQ